MDAVHGPLGRLVVVARDHEEGALRLEQRDEADEVRFGPGIGLAEASRRPVADADPGDPLVLRQTREEPLPLLALDAVRRVVETEDEHWPHALGESPRPEVAL